MAELDQSAAAEAWSLGKLTPVPACPACGGCERDARVYRTRDYLGSDARDEWRLHRCADCASIFLDPRPDDASIPLTYKSYYTHEAPLAHVPGGVISRLVWSVMNGYLASRFAWDLKPRLSLGDWLCRAIPPLKLKLDYFGRHLLHAWFPGKGMLLDIGCGNGEFLA